MRLSHQAIEDFKKIYKEEYGEEISDAEAEDLGIRLLLFIKAVGRPIPSDVNNVDS